MLLLLLLLLASAGPALAQTPPKPPIGPPVVTSPNGAIVVTIGTEGQLTWSVSHRGRAILQPSPLALRLGDGRVLGEKPLLTTSFTRSIDRTLKPVVRYRRAEVRDRFNEVVFA
ncbi:MAG TPA: glycoside hydrolase family 97 N-terminal domain-containing protein, partial [Vicinamibacterales bacterium]|nr:glycoside hydrolase family 97 N-terminal domain-containing protein [Vicinamibacterales bacterium]